MIWDAIIVGAGPAGSTSANLLAARGHRVLVLEREEFPRFHIGESLLPLGTGVLQRLGVQAPPDVFTFKRGAQFICETTNRSLEVAFDEALPGPPRHAWQVERSKFDTMLRDLAIEAGAVVRHGVHVDDLEITDDGVRVGEERGRYLVDATGQGRLMGRRSRSIKPIDGFGIAASYQHFDGVDARAMGAHGDIRIMMRPEGWGWVIPMPNDRLSIGVVTQTKGATKSMIERYVASSPLICEWTSGAAASETHLVGNYAFKNTASFGPRYTCVGDAACFLDPVFSSGVSLALTGAEHTTAVLGPALDEGREAAPDLMAPVSAHMQRAYVTFASLIDRFYNTKFAHNLFLGEAPKGDLRCGIVSVLAGDVWRSDNKFADMLGRSRRIAAVA